MAAVILLKAAVFELQLVDFTGLYFRRFISVVTSYPFREIWPSRCNFYIQEFYAVRINSNTLSYH